MSKTKTKPTRDLTGKAFERRVADAYRAMGYAVIENTQLAGKQTDLVARREVEGAPGIVLAVECKDTGSPVGNTVVDEFVSRVVAQRAAGVITAGALVSATGFTAHAREAASKHASISLLSWNDLISALLDVRSQLTEAVASYESSAIFGHYLPLAVEQLSWDNLTPSDTTRTSAPDVISEWIERSDSADALPNILVILADFGAGKSTLLHHVHYERAKAFLEQRETRVPLFVPLRHFRETQDVATLVRTSFREAYYRDLSNELLWQRIDAGRFYLLLDGFDEMAERSDASRRLDLFRMLVPVLVSPSPTILTSRPSHFVERGELNQLLATLVDAEAAIGALGPSARGGAFATADNLRRGLVDRFRETRPGRPATARLVSRSAHVYQLLPLSRQHIVSFVKARDDELSSANSSADAVVAFIDRTYDLNDLASRPILLAFIAESVMIGALDPEASDVQLGASGLYETYTQAKLELDIAKGPSRADGLSVETRRLLAEELALLMYVEGELEMHFASTFDTLCARCGPLDAEVRERRLTPDEVATDFATSSFITVTEDGQCRFVHKSFRGFFVARALKKRLPKLHPLISEPLEQEVLYFLGGFAPTEPIIGERLWQSLKAAKVGALRRNLLVAYLYTRPRHERVEVRAGEIGDAAFGRLEFGATDFAGVAWTRVTVRELVVSNSNWRDVSFADSHLTSFTTDASRVSVDVRNSTVESWHVERIWDSEWTLCASSIEALTVREADVRIGGEETVVARVVIDASHISLHSGDLVLDAVEMTDSLVELSGPRIKRMRGSGAAITIDLGQSDLPCGELHGSLVVLTAGEKGAYARGANGDETLKIDPTSVVVCRGGVAVEPLVGLEGGLFGEVRSAGGTVRNALSLWGVVNSDALIAAAGVKRGTAGIRVGDLIVTSTKWYEAETKPGGRLAIFADLHKIAARRGAVSEDHGRELGNVLAEIRGAWEDVSNDEWPSPKTRPSWAASS